MEKFYEGTSMPRNREIMRIFKDLDFVEQLGSGIPKIVEKYGRGVFSVSENIVQTVLMLNKKGGGSGSPEITVRKPQEDLKKIARNR
jgi:predicted HTH transcriptional regulator